MLSQFQHIPENCLVVAEADLERLGLFNLSMELFYTFHPTNTRFKIVEYLYLLTPIAGEQTADLLTRLRRLRLTGRKHASNAALLSACISLSRSHHVPYARTGT